MGETNPELRNPDQSPDRQGIESDPGLAEQLGALSAATRNWLSDSIGLALMEGQLAGVSLVRMLIYGLVAVLLFVTGWLALMLALALLLNALGMPLAVVVLVVGALSIITGVILIFKISALSSNVTFRSTRQHLRAGSSDGETGDVAE